MQQRHATALFLISWVGLLGFITWLDVHNVFILMPYLLCVVVLFFPTLAFFTVWKDGPPPIVWIALVIGLAWLIGLPFIPSTAEKALLMQHNHIHIGMTKAQVRATMRGYRASPHTSTRASGVDGLAFCNDDPMYETSAQVDFVAGRVVRVWFDTD
jgi:hypothetical protein